MRPEQPRPLLFYSPSLLHTPCLDQEMGPNLLSEKRNSSFYFSICIKRSMLYFFSHHQPLFLFSTPKQQQQLRSFSQVCKTQLLASPSDNHIQHCLISRLFFFSNIDNQWSTQSPSSPCPSPLSPPPRSATATTARVVTFATRAWPPVHGRLHPLHGHRHLQRLHLPHQRPLHRHLLL